jgi:hypothetical protein
LIEEVFKSVTDALSAGKPAADVHQTIVDHVAELPAKVRA